jgi:hypothetical protein
VFVALHGVPGAPRITRGDLIELSHDPPSDGRIELH